MFTPEEIQARIRQQPFVPVRIVTSAGQTFDVRHPDLIMIGRRSLMIGTASPQNPSVYDQVTRVAILHVTTLEDLPTPSSPAGDGQQ
jgi:hypothetical protein